MSNRQVRMTSQQRVNAMMERRDQDRISRHESFWSDTIERWKTEGLSGDGNTVLDMLQTDFHGLNWIWPQCFPGSDKTISEDAETRIVRDSNGKTLRYWKNRMGTPEHLGFDCDSREKWFNQYKPALLGTGLQNDPAAVARAYRKGRDLGRWCHLTTVEPFEETRALMGDELTMIAMCEDPEWIRDVAVTFTDQVIWNLDAIMSAGIQPDGLWVYGDMAFNHATMCSPAMYKELIWPEHKRLADWAHAHRMKLIYHTDGNVNGVMDLFVEAGFDCFQPIEVKAAMDIRNLVPKYGDKLSFFGNVDVMVMATNDPRKIEDEVRSKIEAGKSRKCYAYHSDHSVPPSVSWRTYQFIMGLIERYGWYD
ncbi:MAG: uroporphyrinogen decarboxylase family protein [Phycisphaerales bacterium]